MSISLFVCLSILIIKRLYLGDWLLHVKISASEASRRASVDITKDCDGIKREFYSREIGVWLSFLGNSRLREVTWLEGFHRRDAAGFDAGHVERRCWRAASKSSVGRGWKRRERKRRGSGGEGSRAISRQRDGSSRGFALSRGGTTLDARRVANPRNRVTLVRSYVNSTRYTGIRDRHRGPRRRNSRRGKNEGGTRVKREEQRRARCLERGVIRQKGS